MINLYKELPEKELKKNSSDLCNNCVHFQHCALRTVEPVYHCEYFEFKEKEEK